MANTRSARKNLRKSRKRTLRNRVHLSRVRTFIRKLDTALASGDLANAEQAFRSAMPEIHKGAQKGVLHRNNASRRISRFALRLNALRKSVQK